MDPFKPVLVLIFNNQVAKMRPINKAAHLDKEQMYDEIQDLRHIIRYSLPNTLIVHGIYNFHFRFYQKSCRPNSVGEAIFATPVLTF